MQRVCWGGNEDPHIHTRGSGEADHWNEQRRHQELPRRSATSAWCVQVVFSRQPDSSPTVISMWVGGSCTLLNKVLCLCLCSYLRKRCSWNRWIWLLWCLNAVCFSLVTLSPWIETYKFVCVGYLSLCLIKLYKITKIDKWPTMTTNKYSLCSIKCEVFCFLGDLT